MKKKKRKRKFLKTFLILLFLVLLVLSAVKKMRQTGKIQDLLQGLLGMEPQEVQQLRKQEISGGEPGKVEYYFSLLDEEEQRAYRQMEAGIKKKEKEFYLTIGDNESVDRVYHAVLKDHPEFFWMHNRNQVIKTTYGEGDYCMFSPSYSYTETETQQILQAMSQACQQLDALIPQGADDYVKAQMAYTYLIDTASYQESEDDQSIAGVFWKKQAVCAGYAGAAQYLLDHLGVYCIYVDGDTKNSDQGHAWNIIKLEGEYYYLDATNGDQPEFLEGDAVQLAEHKTTIYDYLCPFPDEYEQTYTPSAEFKVPACTATAKNFYVLNQGCFDSYDWQSVYDYCKMRLDNGAAVVRFKFSTQKGYEQAYQDLIANKKIQQIALYYIYLQGVEQVEYHYGVLENMKTMYFMF